MYKEMKARFSLGDDIDPDDVAGVFDLLPQMLRLKQISTDPRLMGVEGVTDKGAKIEWLLEFISNYKDTNGNQKPLVIFSQFVSSVHVWQKEIENLGCKVALINGSVIGTKRTETVQLFQAGHIDVLICQTNAAATGITLDRADTVIFMDELYEVHTNIQAQDRVCPTQENVSSVHEVVILYTRGIEERVQEICNAKHKEML